MRDRLETALARLRRGEDPGWLGWRHLRGSDRPEDVEALVRALRPGVVDGLSSRVLEVLAAACQRPAALVSLQRVELADLLTAAMGAEPDPGIDRLLGLPLFGPELLRLYHYGEILAGMGEAAVPGCRRILAGPPMPTWLSDLRSLTDSRHFRFTRFGGGEVLLGAKPEAIAAVSRWGDAGDTDLFRANVINPDEPVWTRVLAAVAWHRLAGAVACPDIARCCLEVPKRFTGDDGYYAPLLARIGSDLTPELVQRLGHAEGFVRQRAVYILIRVGPPAVSALTDLVRDTSDPHQLNNALGALGNIDREARDHALALRTAAGREISLAPDDAPATDRSLSRAEPRDDA